MRTPTSEVEVIAAAFDGGLEVDWAGRDSKLWALALDELVQGARFELAGWAADGLTRSFPRSGVFASQRLLLREAPAPTGDTAFDAFRDDPAADVQLVPRNGADTVLFVFTGVSGRAGMALPLAHRWFGRLGVHVVYLRDLDRQAYNLGVRSFGATYEAALVGCWGLVERLGARRVLTCGNSLGGYAALRFGLDLRAQVTVAFSSMTSMVPPLLSAEEAQRLRLRFALDLRPFLGAASRPPAVTLIYGAECDFDARHARHVEDLASVELQPLPGCSRHESVLRAVELGAYATLLSRLDGGRNVRLGMAGGARPSGA